MEPPSQHGRFLSYFDTWRFDWPDVPYPTVKPSTATSIPSSTAIPSRAGPSLVTLLGDAAHPMYPIGSNGASQAIMDVRVLAREIDTRGVTEAVPRAYE